VIGRILDSGFRESQHSVYSYRVWITLNKRTYAPFRYLKSDSDIHAVE
jgi:hypothetical protein